VGANRSQKGSVEKAQIVIDTDQLLALEREWSGGFYHHATWRTVGDAGKRIKIADPE
jgi:hypothetical protein